MLKRNVLLILVGVIGLSSRSLCADDSRTTSPDYRLQFSFPVEDLVGDLNETDRGNPKYESELPPHEWNSHHVRKQYGAWGPPQAMYPPLRGASDKLVEWKRERVIATAARFIGYEYQHHHIPDWDPPENWPWKHCCAGHNGKGVDCSNFTSFVYNQAFGIRLSSGIRQQSEGHFSHLPREDHVSLRRIDLAENYSKRIKQLRTGDLLYIRGREDGPVTHVVFWVGSIGRAASEVPLVMDSHGSDVDDDNGRPIPCGIHLRPFRENSWYNRCASHALRVF
jgi:cell wall-associated NlpC family hydrolase